MPVLKCIGGTNDGEYYEVNALKSGEVFQIPERYVLKGVVTNRNLKVAKEITTEYTLRYFDFFDKGTFSFLAPKEWTDKQAVEFQFRK